MIEIDGEASFSTALREGMNLMLGAGFSLLSTDQSGKSLPTGYDLAEELRTEFHSEGLAALSLPHLYTILAARDSDAVRDFLTRRFTVSQFDPRYKALLNFSIRAIFTTNIDDLVYRIYADSLTHYLNDLLTRGPTYRDRAAIDYVALHGSVINPDRPYRFSTLELASSFDADPTLWHTLRQRISAFPTLFWGYSLQDAGALEALQSGPGAATHGKSNWIVLRASERDNPLAEYFRALNFQLIFAETHDFLEYLVNTAKEEPQEEGLEKLKTAALAGYRVPAPGAVPQRPIADFYSGAAPSWSDIFRDDLHRIAQYRQAEDLIKGKRNVVITGIPASGKTTLLMQLAAAECGPGVSLILDGAAFEEVERLLRLLDGAPATVFFDNMCDDVDSYNLIADAQNIVAVGADRDYYLSTATHRLRSDITSFVSVSELTQFDFGAIRSRIPAAIRTATMQHPSVTRGLPSILEFNLENTKSRSLIRRLEDALQRLQRDEPRSAEMLVLVSYVHSCRTVLSLDMALGYWRDELSHWSEIYPRIEEVGRLLSEYEGDLTEDEQDYYAARSQIVAEAAVKSAGSALLRSVLERFHYNLPISRICRYDIFKRRGYNHRLVGQAYPRVEDAAEFYNFIYERDPNPYVLQQKALLLSRRQMHAASFVEIDKALGMVRGRNWAIEATHAQLLLDANLPLSSESDEARKQSDKAMRLLRTCYLSDRRRSLHAYRFARSAIRYFDIFGDTQAIDYLVQARDWLKTALRREPFMTQTKYILEDVEGRLR